MNIRIETAQAIWNWYHVKFPQGEKPRCHSSWNLFTTSNAMWSHLGPTCTLAQLWSIEVASVGMLALECSQGTTKNLLFTTQTTFKNILASLDSWESRSSWKLTNLVVFHWPIASCFWLLLWFRFNFLQDHHWSREAHRHTFGAGDSLWQYSHSTSFPAFWF